MTATASPGTGLGFAPDEVRRLVLDVANAGVPGVDSVVRYLPSQPGKGIRPRLTLLAAAAIAVDAPAPVAAAAGIELMHLGTLHHDDVVDESPERRGHPTAAALWGNRAAVFAGTFLLARGTELISGTGERAARAAAACAAELWRGQTRELVSAFRTDRTQETYLNVIECKTGALFGLAGLVGALAADAPAEVADALGRFGRTSGTAFQLADDLADLTSSPCSLGKAVSVDVRVGVYTLPVILALAAGGSAATRLRALLGVPGLDAAGAGEVRQIVAAAGGIDRSLVMLRGLQDRAHAELDVIADSWARDQLHDLVEGVADVV
ncbi:polyprenyl synthetase family protein [Actinosynnema sp. NPDC023794]